MHRQLSGKDLVNIEMRIPTKTTQGTRTNTHNNKQEPTKSQTKTKQLTNDTQKRAITNGSPRSGATQPIYL